MKNGKEDIGAGQKEDVSVEENNEGKGDRVQEARHLVERMEIANQKSEQLLARQEKLYSEMILSGRANAGTPQETKVVETTPAEYAKEVMQGKHNVQSK